VSVGFLISVGILLILGTGAYLLFSRTTFPLFLIVLGCGAFIALVVSAALNYWPRQS
jgi:4-amino-4-deoxy-L-arabinose transferase-like glycosyltransferase